MEQLLLGERWHRLTEEQQKDACLTAHQKGRHLSTHPTEVTPPLYGSLLGLQPDMLYVDQLLSTGAPTYWKDWCGMRKEVRLEDRRVAYFLTSYDRYLRRHRNLAEVSIERSELQEQIAAATLQQEQMQVEMVNWQEKMTSNASANRWRGTRVCTEAVRQARRLQEASAVQVRDLMLHLEVIRLTEEWLGISMAELMAPHPRKEKKQSQRDALEFIALSLRHPEAASVCAAAHQCLQTGILPSDRRLCGPLMSYRSWIRADPRLKALAAVLDRSAGKQRQQRDLSDGSAAVLPSDVIADPVLQRRLERLQAITRGKKALMIGGLERPEAARQIERILELDRLIWPDFEEDRAVRHHYALIQGADLVFMNRFNGKESRAVYKLCSEHGRPLIKLNQYGVHHVIQRSWERLCTPAGKPIHA